MRHVSEGFNNGDIRPEKQENCKTLYFFDRVHRGKKTQVLDAKAGQKTWDM